MQRSRDWLDQAVGDLDHARNDLEHGFYEWACSSGLTPGATIASAATLTCWWCIPASLRPMLIRLCGVASNFPAWSPTSTRSRNIVRPALQPVSPCAALGRDIRPVRGTPGMYLLRAGDWRILIRGERSGESGPHYRSTASGTSVPAVVTKRTSPRRFPGMAGRPAVSRPLHPLDGITPRGGRVRHGPGRTPPSDRVPVPGPPRAAPPAGQRRCGRGK